MYKSLRRIALMLLLVCAFACCAVMAAACGPKEEEPAPEENGKVTYSLTVTKPADLSFDGIKAQWLKSDNSDASGEIALNAEGKASAELEAANYTVTLKGVPAGYTFANASVTAENRNATISVTAQGGDEETSTVMITVRAPSGLSIDFSSVSIQVYKEDTAAGSAIALSSSGIGTVTLPIDNQTYKITLVNLPDYLTYTEVTIVADGNAPGQTIQTQRANVEYTVNVEIAAELEEALEGATVTFYKDDQPVDNGQNIPVENKQAKATLPADDYTAKLTLTDETLSFEEEVDFTVSEREATFNVTANEYTITLSKPGNISDAYTAMTVILTQNGEETEFTGTPEADGTVKIRAPRGDYGVKVKDGSDNEIGHLPVSLSATELTATVELAKIIANGAITAPGRYYVPVTVTSSGDAGGNATTNFTVHVTSQQALYTITWELDVVNNKISISNYGNSKDKFSEDNVKFVLPDVSAGSFSLLYETFGDLEETGKNFGYILNVAIGDVPEKGAVSWDPLDLQDGTNTPNAAWKEVWYKVPHNYPEHKITFGSGITAEFYDYQNQMTAVGNGGYFQGEQGAGTTAAHDGLLHLMSPSANIMFEITAEAQPGESSANAVEITLDEEVSHTFTDSKHWYYKFTPSETGYYDIEKVSSDWTSIDIYKPDGSGKYDEDKGPTIENATRNFRLENGVTYLVRLGWGTNLTISFKIVKHVAAEGEKERPFEVKNTGATATIIPVDFAGGFTYFYHKVTAQSLDSNGKLKLTFEFIDGDLGSITASFFTGDSYTSYLSATPEHKDNTYTLSGFSAGQTVYFAVKSTGSSRLNLYINKPGQEVVPADDALRLNKPTTVDFKDSGGKAFTYTFPLDSAITAGDYIIAYEVNPDPYIYNGQITAFVNNSRVGGYKPDSSTFPTKGEFKVTIPDGAKSIKISMNSGGSPTTYHWTFTIREDKPVLDVDTPVTVDIADLKLGIIAPAGTYTLTIKFESAMAMAQFMVYVGSYSNTVGTTEVTTEVTIGDGDEITWENLAGATGTVTFTLVKKEEAPALELEAGKPLEVTYPAGTSENNYSPEFTFGLKDVAPAKYNLTIAMTTGPNMPFANPWTITVGDQTYQTTKSNSAKTSTVAIIIPKDCTEIKVMMGKIGMETTVKLTLTKTGELDAEPLVLGEPYDLNFTTSRKTIEIPVDFVAGTYKFELDFSAASWAKGNKYYIEVNGTKTYAYNNSLWTYKAVNFEFPADCTKLTIGADTVSEDHVLKATITLVAAAPTTPDPLVLGEPYDVTFTTTQSRFENIPVEFAAGTYNLAIDFSSASWANGNKYYVEVNGTKAYAFDNIMGTYKAVNFEVSEECKSIVLGCESKVGEDHTLKFTITLVKAAEADNKLEVGTEKTVTIPTDNDQTVALTVELEEGEYTIKITGEKAESVACFDDTFTLGFGGTIIEPGSGATGTFSVTSAKTYTLSFQDGDYKGGFEVTILITKAEAVKRDTIVVGTEKTITVPADGEHEISLDVTFETSGDYVITLTYETGSITVTESTSSLGAEGVVLAAGVKTGEISVKLPNTYTLTFKGDGETEVRVLISAKEEEETLTVGKPFTVTFEANETSMEEQTFTITLENGAYDIKVEGDHSAVAVFSGDEDSLVYRGGETGEINSDGGVYTLIIRYYEKTGCTFTITITAKS